MIFLCQSFTQVLDAEICWFIARCVGKAFRQNRQCFDTLRGMVWCSMVTSYHSTAIPALANSGKIQVSNFRQITVVIYGLGKKSRTNQSDHFSFELETLPAHIFWPTIVPACHFFFQTLTTACCQWSCFFALFTRFFGVHLFV